MIKMDGRISILISEENKEKLQIEAKKEDLTTSQLIRKIINIFLGED